MAIIGGIVLCALILLVCLSVLGRSLNTLLHGPIESIAPGLSQSLLDFGIGPINGDFEIVEAGIAFAIFAFLPLCQITGSHATVDIFTAKLPVRVNRFLRMVIEAVFAAVLILIAYKLFGGMQTKMRYGETTFLLQFPIWWAYAVSLIAAIAAAITATFVAVIRIQEFVVNQTILPDGEGADH